METDDGSSDWMGIDLLHEGEDGWAGQCGGDGDDERRRKFNLLHERFPKLGALLTVVLLCFAQGVDTYLLGEKLPTSVSISNMVLINVATSTFTNGPK